MNLTPLYQKLLNDAGILQLDPTRSRDDYDVMSLIASLLHFTQVEASIVRVSLKSKDPTTGFQINSGQAFYFLKIGNQFADTFGLSSKNILFDQLRKQDNFLNSLKPKLLIEHLGRIDHIDSSFAFGWIFAPDVKDIYKSTIENFNEEYSRYQRACEEGQELHQATPVVEAIRRGVRL